METEITPQPQKRQRSTATPWLLFVLAAGALGAVLYFGRDLLMSERGRADGARREMSDLNVKLAEAEAARRGLEERVKGLESDKATLSQSMTALADDLEQKEAELARLKATYDSLEERMQAEIKKGEIRLTQDEGRIKVDLVDKVLFDSGQAELSPRGVEVLSRIAGVLSKIDDKQIQVAGHTDDAQIVNELKQTFPTNWELSAARAVNVVRFLAEKGGVPAKRLVAAGHGQFLPVASNSSPQGRAQNRRIEILLTPVLKGAQQKVAVAKTASAAPAAKKAPVAKAAPKRKAR
ncbi:MAG TPA: OmpA family protein [Myxococcaceae bacterium]|nr:OmpA family protein [Myxococcaceae bacterium]